MSGVIYLSYKSLWTNVGLKRGYINAVYYFIYLLIDIHGHTPYTQASYASAWLHSYIILLTTFSDRIIYTTKQFNKLMNNLSSTCLKLKKTVLCWSVPYCLKFEYCYILCNVCYCWSIHFFTGDVFHHHSTT